MPEKGPLVFLDYDQAALDAAYDQAAYAPNRDQLVRRRVATAPRRAPGSARPSGSPMGMPRSRSSTSTGLLRDRAPIFVFIHGGAWRGGRAEEYAAPAEMFGAAGVHYVVPDFSWVQDAGGSLMALADQVCRAIAWVYRNAARFGGDPSRLLCLRPVLGRASGGGRADHRLATRIRPAGRHHQGRPLHQRHVRIGAGAAVEAQRLCRVRRRDGRGG